MFDDDMSFLDDCEHPYVEDEFCSECGLSMGRVILYEIGFRPGHISHQKSSQQKFKEIIDSLDGISDELKLVVAEKLQNSSSARSNYQIDVFCEVYVNGARTNELKPDRVIKSLKLKGKTLNKSLRIISGTSKKNMSDSKGNAIALPVVSLGPSDYVVEMCDQLEISEYAEEITELINSTMKRDRSLSNERPNRVAAGFIQYFLQTNGINISNMSSIIDMSVPTLNHYTAKIRRVCS